MSTTWVETVSHRVAIAGHVSVAATGAAVPGALVTLETGPADFIARRDRLAATHGSAWATLGQRPDRVRTAADGVFWFLDLPPGTYTLSAALPAAGGRYGTGTGTAQVASGADPPPARVELAIPATELAGQILDGAVTYAGHVAVEPALRAYWRLGEPAGPALDEVAGRTAVAAGGVTFNVAGLIAGDADTAVRFAGGVLETPYAAALNGPRFAVEAWASATGGGTVRTVAAARAGPARGWALYASAQDRWVLALGDGSAAQEVVGPAVTAQRATHLVGTFDGTVARLYVDGTPAAHREGIAFAANDAAPVRIGAAGSGSAPAAPFAGVVDEVALYDRALPAESVSGHHDLGATPHPPVPIALAAVHVAGSGERALTDMQGRYALPGLEPGRRSVTLRATGHETQTATVDLTSGAPTTLNAVLGAARPAG